MNYLGVEEVKIETIDQEEVDKVTGKIDLGIKTPMTNEAEKELVKDLIREGKLKIPEKKLPLGIIRVRSGLYNYFIKFKKA